MLLIQGYGRIASDVPLKRSKDGKHLYTNFLLASHKGKKTIFIRCVAFDAMASLLHEYFCKGDRIVLHGDIIFDDYKDARYKYQIQVRDFDFVESKEEHRKNEEKHGASRKEKKDDSGDSKSTG